MSVPQKRRSFAGSTRGSEWSRAVDLHLRRAFPGYVAKQGGVGAPGQQHPSTVPMISLMRDSKSHLANSAPLGVQELVGGPGEDICCGFLVHTYQLRHITADIVYYYQCACQLPLLRAYAMACNSSWRPFAFRCCCFLKKQPAPAPAATRNTTTRPSGTPQSSLAVTTGAACNACYSANSGRSRSTHREAGGEIGEWILPRLHATVMADVNQAHRQRGGAHLIAPSSKMHGELNQNPE